MFIGQYFQKVDEKKRIIIPSKFREKLSFGSIITLGYDKCLSIYTGEEWVKLQEKLLSLSETKSDYRKHVRAIASSATECDVDAHGRVLIPSKLLETIGIDKEVVIVGNLDHVEIWSKEIWESYYKDSVDSFDELAERLDN